MASEDQNTVFRALKGLEVVDGTAKLDIYNKPFIEIDRVFFYREEGTLGFMVIASEDVN